MKLDKAGAGALETPLAQLLLSLADDEFVIGFWDSEWTGIAPMLEEDVATSSISQDEIGHARALYELLADETGLDADAIAFGRDADAYRHAALLNHARQDWAFSVARRYLYETADAVRLEALSRSSHDRLAGLAAKMRREERYHRMHVDAWLHRLAASPDAHDRLAQALRQLWPDALSVLGSIPGESALVTDGVLPEPMAALRARWLEEVRATLGGLSLPGPPAETGTAGDPSGRTRRTDEFRWLHGEFTMVARSEEAATW